MNEEKINAVSNDELLQYAALDEKIRKIAKLLLPPGDYPDWIDVENGLVTITYTDHDGDRCTKEIDVEDFIACDSKSKATEILEKLRKEELLEYEKRIEQERAAEAARREQQERKELVRLKKKYKDPYGPVLGGPGSPGYDSGEVL